MTITRVVFAYDGSASATAAIAWMRDAYAAAGPGSTATAGLASADRVAGSRVAGSTVEVVTLTLDLGQRDELDAVRERALAAGAVRAHVLDVRESFAHDYLLPALRAGAACDEAGRPMGRALSRPLIARQLVEVARMEGTAVVAHGAWRDAADRARLEQALRLLAPDIEVRAPLVAWGASDDDIEAFAQAHRLRLPRVVSRVAMDVWGRCALARDEADGEALDDARDASGDDAAADHASVYAWTKAPDEALDTPAFVDVEFERGAPVGISGVGMPLLEIISSLETIAGAHGVGRSHGGSHARPLVSRILIGSVDEPDARADAGGHASGAAGAHADATPDASVDAPGDTGDELCEAPAATVLVVAHDALSRAVLPDEVVKPHAQVREWYRDLVTRGAWAGVAREACQAFIDRTQARVTGSVRVELSRGTCRVVDVGVREGAAARDARAMGA